MPEPLKPGDLINAVRFSQIEKVKDLLTRGADANEKDNIGTTSLIYAAGRQNFIGIARLLLDNGALIDEQNDYGTNALINAASCRNMEMVRFLLDNGASPFEKNKKGYTAQNVAEARGHVEIARMLREATATRRNLDAEKARVEASHTLAATRQERLKKTAPRFRLG